MEISPGIAALLSGLAVFLMLYSLFAPKTFEKADITDTAFNNDVAAEPNAFDRYIRPALRNFLPQTPLSASLSSKQRSSIEELLVRSGNPWKIRPEEYIGTQVLFVFVGTIAGIVLAFFELIPGVPPLAVIPVLAVVGYLIPFSYHNTLRENRIKEVQKQLPEALDLLVITLSSGQNFEPALRSVVPRLPAGLLKEELKRTVLEIRSGRSLDSALTGFADRSASDESASFAKAIVQAQKLGSDVSTTLELQAQSARRGYEARLEKKIARLSTTMFIPLIGTMLPAMLIIFTAPALMQFGEMF